MATFLVQDLQGNPLYSVDKRDKAVAVADRYRRSGTECYILKQFSKAGHPHIARIEYNKCNYWEEQESQRL